MTNATTTTNATNAIDIASAIKSFNTSLGNGKKAATYLCKIVEWTINGVDTDSTKLSGIIDKAEREGDTNAARAIRSIVGSIWTSAKASKSKDKRSTVLKLGNVVDGDALARLIEAQVKGLSLRDTLVKHVKGDTDKAPVELPKWAAAQIKRMEKEGFTRAALIAALQGVGETEVAF